MKTNTNTWKQKTISGLNTIFIVLIISILTFSVKGQDIHFTQIQYFPLSLNPAMSGANYALSGNIIYRNQWKAVASPYNTFGLSVDGRISKSPKGHFFAGGIKFFNDNTGDLSLKTNDVTLNGAYHLRVNQGQHLGIGIYAGIIQKSINMNNAQWESQYDDNAGVYNPSAPSNENFAPNSFIVPDAGLGFTYTYDKNEGMYNRGGQNIKFNIGFSAFHVNMPASTFLKNSKDKMYIRYVGFASGDIGIGKSAFAVCPLLVYQLQGPTAELLAGFYGKYTFAKQQQGKSGGSVALGSIYRNKDAVTTNIVLEYDSYSIGFSYDINISQLKTISRGKGAMEIFIRYVLPSPYGPGSSKARI
ncbi:MAG: PorP/SprF family type IX secretion system membrane protein [Bacteroidota bacterium]